MDSEKTRGHGFDAIHAERVQQSLEELQQMVRDHEVALNKVRLSPGQILFSIYVRLIHFKAPCLTG